MKIAILVFGEFREFEFAHKSWTFLNNIDYDIYVATWNITQENNKDYLNIDITEEVTENRILKYFPDATISINEPFTSLSSTKMTYLWRKLFNLTTISGKKYDNVILLRTDIMIKENGYFHELINSTIPKSTIYNLSGIVHQPPPSFMFAQDVFFLGEYEYMKEIFLSFIPPDVIRQSIHLHLAKHFINNDVYIETIFPDIILNYYIMRSINRGFLDVDFDLQKDISEEWWNLKHNNLKPIKTLKLLEKKIINENSNLF